MCWLSTPGKPRQRDGVLEMAADCQHGRCRVRRRQRHGQGRITPRPAQDQFASRNQPHYGVIACRTMGRLCTRNRSAMRPSRATRLAFRNANRLVAEVAAGGDDGKTQHPEQEMMQRGIWQHDARQGLAAPPRGDAGGRVSLRLQRAGPEVQWDTPATAAAALRAAQPCRPA
jgi:hypothetical protein